MLDLHAEAPLSQSGDALHSVCHIMEERFMGHPLEMQHFEELTSNPRLAMCGTKYTGWYLQMHAPSPSFSLQDCQQLNFSYSEIYDLT